MGDRRGRAKETLGWSGVETFLALLDSVQPLRHLARVAGGGNVTIMVTHLGALERFGQPLEEPGQRVALVGSLKSPFHRGPFTPTGSLGALQHHYGEPPVFKKKIENADKRHRISQLTPAWL